MSGRLLALVMVLAIVSAAVGTGAAFLLRSTSDDSRPASEVSVVAATRPTPAQEQAAEAEEVQEIEEEIEPETEMAPAPDPQLERAQDEEQVEPPIEEPSSLSEVSEETQQEQVAQQARQEHQESQQVESAQPEQLDEALAAPDVIVQGEAFALTVTSAGASTAAATLDNRSWELAPIAPGAWWGIIAVPRDAEIGATDVLIDLYGDGGAWLRTLSVPIVVLASTVPLEEIELGGTGVAPDPAEVARDIAVRFSEHTEVTGPPRWQGVWMLPVEGEVTGLFGAERSYDGVPSAEWHHGHDIAAQHGDPIVAPAHGTVVWTGDLVLHGMGVILDHGAGVYSGYWHMSMIAVRVGFDVEPGDWLGNIGTTGLSTGPHLHWEVIIRGIDVDPVQWTSEDRPPLPLLAAATEESADTLQ